MSTGERGRSLPRAAWTPTLVVAGLAASAAAVALIPAVMPADYLWLARTTSEAAAQGLTGAWLSRLGFLLFGLSVLLLAGLRRGSWGSWGTAAHAAFGALMTTAAAFSHRPWQGTATVDRTEDLLHSVSATGMGFAFAAGVVIVVLGRQGPRRRVRILDLVAVTASVALPLAMSAVPELDGLLQRSMFAVAYLWYAREALDARGTSAAPASQTYAPGRPRPEELTWTETTKGVPRVD